MKREPIRNLKLRASIAAALAACPLTTTDLATACAAKPIEVRRELWEMLSHHEVATAPNNTWSLVATTAPATPEAKAAAEAAIRSDRSRR